MQNEPVLNLEKNKKELTLKALNQARNVKEAARLLGRSSKTIHRYMKQWRMKRDVGGDYYYAPKN